jgi:hypothetical protein
LGSRSRRSRRFIEGDSATGLASLRVVHADDDDPILLDGVVHEIREPIDQCAANGAVNLGPNERKILNASEGRSQFTGETCPEALATTFVEQSRIPGLAGGHTKPADAHVLSR